MPEKVRAFVALYPPAEIVSRLGDVEKHFRSIGMANELKWTKPEQIHLTLQFLGSVSGQLIGQFASGLENVTANFPVFQLRAESLGCFPSERRLKILWAGLTGDLEQLDSLKANLDIRFRTLGFVPEKRKFHAHLTLARFGNLKSTDARRLTQEFTRWRCEPFGEWKVREISLMQSILSPQGARHIALNSAALKKV
jgi:2'-5' RNA ligase